ncbi:MAG: fused MFS/spermidine synthase [Thermoanaerobaculia bacterium]
MTRRGAGLGLCLFGSGFCALAYQVVWLREFRLIFGASTTASAAVLAIFIGGLGLGSQVLGPKADRHPMPVRFYATLEIGIFVSAALSPFLLTLCRRIYLAAGGSASMGSFGGNAARLILSAVVLGIPTFLMGGTLPAAIRGAETRDDGARAIVGRLYGVNTLGAVAGCLGANFFLLETLGNRSTLLFAAAINGIVAAAAFVLGGKMPEGPGREKDGERQREPSRPRKDVVLAAAGVVGFVFFMMEIVWYRMLAPLLGGSVFTFALILAVALAGIGVGGFLYGLRPTSPEPVDFSLSCLIEAASIAVPFALGDRIAIAALRLQAWAQLDFSRIVAGWAGITALVVAPCAIVAGYQFPLLIGLLGEGDRHVARDVGHAYAANTAGAMAGALAAGFGLLPLLTAPGCWRAAVILLLALGAATALLAVSRSRRVAIVAAAGIAAATAGLLFARGPTAVWRHSSIGVGRVPVAVATTRNRLHDWINATRRTISWEAEGIESSVALQSADAYSFIVNGKSDGNAVHDSPTQVMSGLLGCLRNPSVKRALVIGLGTGSTAGWLGSVPGIERVDVFELEPSIREVARVCSPVNRNVLTNPKVHVEIGDARELLMTSAGSYDLIFSEPSNPYRAGIASLFTREYYEAASRRLSGGGVFLQWIQGYEIGDETLRTIYVTLSAVFPSIETWQTGGNDLLLVASTGERVMADSALRARIASSPFREALADSWRVVDLEGVLAHYVANAAFARSLAAGRPRFNTDDRNIVEFGFARSVGRKKLFAVEGLVAAARSRRENRPRVSGESIAWDRVDEQRLQIPGSRAPDPPDASLEARHRARALSLFRARSFGQAAAEWDAQSRPPESLLEIEAVGVGRALAGDGRCGEEIALLRRWEPAAADSLLAVLRCRQGRFAESVSALAASLREYRTDPWSSDLVMQQGLLIAPVLASREKSAASLLSLLETPFCVASLNEWRLSTALAVARQLGSPAACASVLRLYEPNVPWTLAILSARVTYFAGDRVLGPRSEADFEDFLSHEPRGRSGQGSRGSTFSGSAPKDPGIRAEP